MKISCWNALLWMAVGVAGLSLRPSSTSSFHGSPLLIWKEENNAAANSPSDHRAQLYMRKQKASDRRTRRRQRGEGMDEATITLSSVTTSPMNVEGEWKQKTATRSALLSKQVTGGRGRSRKRSMLYTSLSFYSNKFMHLLQAEYKAEEDEVLGRIKASLDEPISLEVAGYALYDMEASRRGNLFSDEVYRLTKAPDATTVYDTTSDNDDISKGPRKGNSSKSPMPPNHKFRPNDVILLTLQPKGSGDFFDSTTTSPLSEEATQLEARVLNVGPTYVDIATQAGKFASTLGPAPNEDGGGPKRQSQRLRVDRFFSDIPYQRMVAALRQLSQIPDRQQEADPPKVGENANSNPLARIRMDTILSHVIVSTHAYADPESPLLRDPGVCDLDEIAKHIAKPPMRTSAKLAHEAIRYMQAHPQVFRQLNGPQMAAVEAALARRLTLVHGPPGTGKTTVSAAIGFGMVHQCRSISADSAKVLACAFSNVGADNLAQALQSVGLNVLRIGKPSAVTQSLWNSTLDAAIDRDPDARKALEVAAKATARLSKVKYMDKTEEKLVRQAATQAVKASQKACLVAATRAMREVDVIVSTSTGAADPRLMAACGISTGELEEDDSSKNPFKTSNLGTKSADDRTLAPDGLPPLSLPFVIVDEACQSVEPATLIPLVSSDTCRSLVLLGDPCQLPPTVRSDTDNTSPLSVSLMERLASALPAPHVRSPLDPSPMDTTYLQALPIKQCRSLLHAFEKGEDHQRSDSYRKRFAGSVLLSIQYRSHPSIVAYPSAIFYDGLLATPEFMSNVRHAPKSLQKLFPMSNDKSQDLCVRWVNVGGRNNERRGSLSSLARTSFGATPEAIEEQTSYMNEPEAEQVVKLLGDIVASRDEEVQSIGVISPYAAQVQLIQSLLTNNPSLQDQLSERNVELEVKSVDGYQGRERDVIIFSAVRSNRHGKIGFLRDWRRMNVALTRAKSFSVVVGDLETLSDTDKYWAALAKWSEGTGCVVEIADT
eukprot:scaffold1667_cov173-Amphora_coffeaeformis.AAC.28